MSGAPSIHACAIVLGRRGILIRGPSGSGKTELAQTLVEAETNAARFACWIADDRVLLRRSGEAIILSCPAAIEGQREQRFSGIEPMEFTEAARLDLVIDLVAADTLRRMPESSTVEIDGVAIAAIEVPQRQTLTAAQIVRARLVRPA